MSESMHVSADGGDIIGLQNVLPPWRRQAII